MADADETQVFYSRSTLRRLIPATARKDEEKWLSTALHVVTPNGRMHLAATAFLLSLSRSCGSEDTLGQYGRILTDFLCVLEEANDGTGIPIAAVDDAILERWKISQIEHRKVGVRTFRDRLRLVLRFILYSQTNGWISPIIGEALGSQILVRWDGARMRHDLEETRARKPATVAVPQREFRIIDAEIETRCKRLLTRRTRSLLSRLLRIAAFRRSEGLRLTVDDIPSRRSLEMLRAKVAEGNAEPIISFEIMSSKNGGLREVSIPLSLASDIREFIDTERAAFLHRKGISAKAQRAVFLSQKTGYALTPQAITNYWKEAARSAAKRLGRPKLARHRPHFCRHRGITDFARLCLKAGRPPAETMYKVLRFARIERLSTAYTYVHLAQDELKERVQPSESDARAQEAEIQKLVMMERQF